MANDRFEGAKTAYMTGCGYINEMIKELGAEQTFALMTKSDSERGISVGQIVREEKGGKDLDVLKTMQAICDMAQDIGAHDTVKEVSEEKAVTVTEMGNCPIYEAARDLGMDDEKIEAICRAGSAVFLDNVVKQLNPKLSYIVTKFRSEEAGGCEEVITYTNSEKKA